ncbi:hypothetical protein IWQ57_004368, partial [Coemansia nantahalensis]
MAEAQLRLQNTEVFVGLAGSHHAAQPGDTSKYFTRAGDGNGGAERVHVDGCTGDAGRLFAASGLQSYVRHAVEGGTAAVFVSGAGLARGADYDRRGLMAALCREIGRSMAAFDPDLSMTYAFVGVTDSRVVDFHRDRTVGSERLAGGLAGLQHEVDDWEALEAKILRGATLPSVLSLRFESLRGGAPTNGQLCVVDMGVVSWAAGDPLDGVDGEAGGMLQQSVHALGRLVRLLSGGGVLAGATVPSCALLDLVGEFLYGQSKTAFVVYLGTDEGAAGEVAATAALAQAVRRLRSREARQPVDRRVVFFYEKARYYQGEKYRLQDELADAQEEKEQAERDLDDVQRDFGEEREALAREVAHWQAKSGDLERTLEAVQAASAGAEAEARLEATRLVTEKLQLRDELRRAEVEMTAAEDAKTRLLDLHDGLQGAYDSLDAVYSELVAAYRALKGRYTELADAHSAVADSAAAHERRAERHAAQAAQLKDAVAAHDRAAAEQAASHAQQIDDLQSALRDQTQRAREAAARAAQLETTNAALAASQSEEAATRQAAVAELSVQLEAHERQAARDASAAAAELQKAQQAVRRLEAENAALARSAEQLAAAGDAQHDLSEQRLQWDHERDQLQRQIARLQTAAANSQRREAELREESEHQWAAWEDEKTKSHERYIRLKARFRDAVEFAAGVQARLDGGAPATPESPEGAVAAATRTVDALALAPEPAPDAGPARTVDAPAPARKPRARRAPATKAGRAEPAAATADDNDSDDSEISFNPAAMAPKAPARAKRP